MLMIGTFDGLGHRPHVLVALVEDEVVADADAVAHRGQNLAGVVRRFAVADLRGVGVEEVGVAAELRHAGFEGVAGARRLVEEQQERRLMRQQQRRLAAMVLVLQVGRRIEQQPNLVVAQILGLDVVFAFEICHRLLAFSDRSTTETRNLTEITGSAGFTG